MGRRRRDVPSRSAALKWFGVSVLVDLAFVLAGFWDRSFWWLAGLFCLLTLWNAFAIRWVDRRGRWAGMV